MLPSLHIQGPIIAPANRGLPLGGWTYGKLTRNAGHRCLSRIQLAIRKPPVHGIVLNLLNPHSMHADIDACWQCWLWIAACFARNPIDISVADPYAAASVRPKSE
jgi:hypothetical protein